MADAPAPLPHAVLVGAPSTGKHRLIQSLTGSADKTQGSSYPLSLDTKYYTAEVAVRAASARHSLDLASCEALVLVFDASSEASFQAIKSWNAVNDSSDLDVRLVVATKVDLLHDASRGIARQRWLTEAMEWCSEQMFEYIETAAAQAQLDSTLQLDEEQQGVARVLAALQAHTWPGLVMKPRPGVTAAGAGRRKDASDAAGEASTVAASSGEVGGNALPAGARAEAAASVAAASMAATSGAAAAAATQPEEPPLDSSSEQPAAAAAALKSGNGEGGDDVGSSPSGDDQDAERLVDQFEAMMSQVAGGQAESIVLLARCTYSWLQCRALHCAVHCCHVPRWLVKWRRLLRRCACCLLHCASRWRRPAPKSNCACHPTTPHCTGMRERARILPDEQRRDNAAKMAFQLMQMFGLEEESGGGSEEEDAVLAAA